MFVLTYWTLVYRRPHGHPLNKPMLLAAIVMFVLATMVRLTRGILRCSHRTITK